MRRDIVEKKGKERAIGSEMAFVVSHHSLFFCSMVQLLKKIQPNFWLLLL